MKCKLYNLNSDLDAVWISWDKLKSHWARNTFHPLTIDELELAFHELWFSVDNRNTALFEIGAIHFDEASNSIMFHNGRHRTILLSNYLKEIPIAICSTVRDNDAINECIIRDILEDDLIELPDLPIKRCSELTKKYCKQN